MYMYLLEMKIGSSMGVCYSTMVATNFSRNFSNTRKNFPRIFFFFFPQYESQCVQQFLIFRFIFFRRISRLFFVLIENQYSPFEVRKKSFRKKKKEKTCFPSHRRDVCRNLSKRFRFFFAKIPLFPPFHFRFQRLNDEATIPRANLEPKHTAK